MIYSPFNGTRGRSAEHLAGTLNRVVSILLQGVALHGFQYERESFERFQAGIRKVRADFNDAMDEDTALLLAGNAIRLMEDHSADCERYLQARKLETESTIAHLVENLSQALGATPEAMVEMKEAERDLASASRPEDLAAARARLTACVETVRAGCDETKKALAEVEGDHDSVTGLPDSAFAEHAMAAVWARRHTHYAVIFALERLEAINLRFGFKAGDELLLILSQHVAQHMRPDDTLFRWRGPCVMALIERTVHESVIKSEFSRIAAVRLEHPIRKLDREVMVPISMSWNLLPLSASSSLDELVSSLNEFAATRSDRMR